MTVSVNTKNTFKIQLVLLSFLFLFIFSIHSNASTGNPVNDGTYTIISALSDNKVLDIDHNNTSSGANLQLYEKNGTSAQLFYLKSLGNNNYIICGRNSGKVLTVDNTNKSNVYQDDWTKNQNQLWELIATNDDYYFIKSKYNDLYLDVCGGETTNSTNIQVYPYNNTNAQKFKFCLETSITGRVFTNGASLRLRSAPNTNSDILYNILNGTELPVLGRVYIDNDHWFMTSYNNQIGFVSNTYFYPSYTDIIFQDFISQLYMDTSLLNDSTKPVIEKLGFYIMNFNHGKKYDIKVQSCWESMFPELPYLGLSGIFTFKNYIVHSEALGNLLYGFTGRYLNFSDRTIFQGGGFAASGKTFLNDSNNYYGDSYEDHQCIQAGIRLCSESSGSIDIDLNTIPFLNLYEFAQKYKLI